ncbi:MAG: hypothetical protein Q7T30_01565 [Planctomycetota bacterium]|nr:hypothetical protein [Planctomycetota bacterium]
MKNPITSFSASCLRQARFLIPAASLAAALTGSATVFDLNGSGDWATGANWVGGIVPDETVSGIAEFTQAESQEATLSANRIVGRISVSSTAKTIRGIGGVQTLTLITSSGITPSSMGGSTTLTLDSVNMIKSAANAFNWNTGGNAIAFLNSGQYTHQSGNLSLTGAGSFTGSGGTLSVTGGTFSLTGSGALTLGAGVGSTFSTGSTISSVSGASIANAGTLNLSGAVFSGAGALALSNTGTLNVGTTDSSLTAGSTLGLTGGTFGVNITGDATAGSITTTGAITLSSAPTLAVTSVDVTDGSIFTILSGGSLSGTFSGLADNATFMAGAQQYQINYSGTSATLTAVPEPQHFAAAVGLGLLGFTMWRRQQKRA